MQTRNKQVPEWFFAGGGAFTLPRAVNTYNPQAKVVVAEIDPAVTRIAEDKLFLNTDNMRVIHADARVALAQQLPAQFDVIVGDVFHDISVPYHLLTREFAQLVKSRLKPDGIYLMNLVDGFPNAKLLKSLYKTLSQDFSHVDIWLDRISDKPVRMTYVLSAHNNQGSMPESLKANNLEREWLNVTQPALKTGENIRDLPLLSDDYVPVERLLFELLAGKLGK
jgi:spermidine synthase